ncbi:MAG: hypothetical protein GY862_04690 [Gammaproteobacteria bacterium]|nr:hypothetical protein [Gammaproteobacteria bacterium]
MPKYTSIRKHIESLKFQLFLLGGLVFVYSLIFSGFFPNQSGTLGHDYAYFFPRILSGYYWFKANGLFAVPWFTPALCGGTMLFANPQDLYFSVPQFLTFLANPLKSVWLTFIIFSATGALGFYLLLRKAFACSPWGALLGGTLFLFNGFYTYRILVGHLSYHGFMLLPFIAFFLIWPDSEKSDRQENLAAGIIAAMLTSCVFYGGGVHLLIPMGMAVTAVILIHALTQTGTKQRPAYSGTRFSVFFIVVFLLFAAKLTVALYTMKNLPRSDYPLPGIPDLADAFLLPFKSLFFTTLQWNEAQNIFTNIKWALQRHEFEIGITFIPLLLIAAGAMHIVFSFCKKGGGGSRWQARQWFYFIVLLCILIIPIMVNFYSPQWNAILKQMPVIKSSSTLVRWYCVYIPAAILATVISFERFQLSSAVKAGSVAVFIAVIISVNIMQDKSFYAKQSYQPSPILAAYARTKTDGNIPNIKYTGARIGNHPIVDDAIMTLGVSQVQCYEPLFGYRHEFFPKKEMLKAGPIDKLEHKRFNMKNPACYTFPESNSCRPGDHFKANQREALLAFAHYESYEFKMPLIQKTADFITLFSFAACVLYLLQHVFHVIRGR